MATEIKATIYELCNIQTEIKSLNQKRKVLNERKKFLEEKIQEYLKAQGLPGVKSQDVAVALKEKEAFGRKKVKESDADSVAVLERYGVENAERVLKEIMEARKGDPFIKPKLIIKSLQG